MTINTEQGKHQKNNAEFIITVLILPTYTDAKRRYQNFVVVSLFTESVTDQPHLIYFFSSLFTFCEHIVPLNRNARQTSCDSQIYSRINVITTQIVSTKKIVFSLIFNSCDSHHEQTELCGTFTKGYNSFSGIFARRNNLIRFFAACSFSAAA